MLGTAPRDPHACLRFTVGHFNYISPFFSFFFTKMWPTRLLLLRCCCCSAYTTCKHEQSLPVKSGWVTVVTILAGNGAGPPHDCFITQYLFWIFAFLVSLTQMHLEVEFTVVVGFARTGDGRNHRQGATFAPTGIAIGGESKARRKHNTY